MKIRIIYFSMSGNTRHFVQLLQKYAEEQHQLSDENKEIEIVEITNQTLLAKEEEDFFIFVPTYLDGGNGVETGHHEIVTNHLKDYIAHEKNFCRCLGVVGSGNRNFNLQYCLTAKQYAADFQVPFLADYELRGSSYDCERIYPMILEIAANRNR